MASQCLKTHKRKPSFFKVLIRDFSTRLQIPPSFIREFGKDGVPKRTTLEIYNGKCWEVGVQKLGKNFYFNNGWDKFVKINSLEIGDFLVVKYIAGYSKFKVKIFGKTCCEKELNGERCSVITLDGKQEDKRNEQNGGKRKRYNIEENGNYVNKDGKSKAYKIDVIKLESDNSSSSYDDDDNDDEEQEYGGAQKRQAKAANFRRNKKYGRVLADHLNLIKFETKNPFFRFQLSYSTVNFYLHIPTGFFKEHMKGNRWIELEVSEKTWKLEINVYDGERDTKRRNDARVTKGWKILVKEHHLKVGDVCIFEMIKGHDSNHCVFQVHVYRWDHQKAEFFQII